MSGIQAVELQRRLRREYPNLPVIIITADLDERIRQRAPPDGAAFFFRKPFDSDDLHFLSAYL